MNGLKLLSFMISMSFYGLISAEPKGPMTEVEMIEALLNQSRPLVPPPGEGGTVTVSHSLHLIRIVDMDVERQVLMTDAWLQMSWRDEHLAEIFQDADPTVQTVNLPHSKIWKPDIILYNNAATNLDYTVDVLVVIARDGTVFFIPPMRMQTYCEAPRDVTTDDTITCDLTFGSWTYDSGRVNMTIDPGYNWENSEFINTFNHDWEVTSFVTKRNEKKYSCCPELYVDVMYSLTLRRK